MPLSRLAPALGNDIIRCLLFASPVPNAGEKYIPAPSRNVSDSYIQNAELKENNCLHKRVAMRGTTRPQSAAMKRD
jgi:hypothetical protein